MPKTTPITYELKQEIRKVHALDPKRSNRQIAQEFGIHHKTVGRILQEEFTEKFVQFMDERGVQYPKGDPAKSIGEDIKYNSVTGPFLTETSEIKNDTWVISLPKTRIHTLEELISFCEVDLTQWRVDRFICNKWEVGIKKGIGEEAKIEVEPLFQIKAFLRKQKDVEAAKNEIEQLKELAKEYSPKLLPYFTDRNEDNLMLEINLPDAHIGKLSWGVETGHGNYDVKIAEAVYWAALETLLARVAHRVFSKILFVVGNDLLNSDDIEGRTTAGTYVSSDARYHKTFSAIRTLMVDAIERLRRVAPVKVVVVSGNHDQLSAWHLGDSLECFFHKYADVEIDNLPRARKYHQHGLVGLMFTHGHKARRQDYPLLMAAEQPQMWGSTKFREIHTGHLHMTKMDEQHGVRVRVLPALTAVDDWLATNGFVGNLRNAEGYVWSPVQGLIEQVYYTVPEEA